MHIPYSKYEFKHFALILLISCALIFPIFWFGIPDMSDMYQHIIFADSYQNSLKIGELQPAWAATDIAGYGSPGIRFYPPLGYYPMASAYLATGNWYDAIWISMLFWLILSGCGAYFFARNWFSPKIALISAVAYLVIPYHLNQIYIGFAYAEFVAAAILPFCFAFAYRTIKTGGVKNIIGFSFFYGLLILSHIPLALVGSISLGIYILLSLRRKNLAREILCLGIAINGGIALSSFYWIKLVTEIAWVNHNLPEFASGHYSYAANFFPLSYNAAKQILAKQFFDFGVLFTVMIFIAGLAVLILTRNNHENESPRELRKFLTVGIFALFMASKLSQPVWDILPLIPKIQFPFRWFTITTLMAAICIGFISEFVVQKQLFQMRSISNGISAVVIILLVFLVVSFFLPSSFMPLNRETLSKNLKSGAIDQSFYCWWSPWSKPEAIKSSELIDSGERRKSIEIWETTDRQFIIADGAPTDVRVSTFYYPYWKATINGTQAAIRKDNNGAIVIPVQKGVSHVRLYFQEPISIFVAKILSSGVLLLMLFFIAGAGFHSRFCRSKSTFPYQS